MARYDKDSGNYILVYHRTDAFNFNFRSKSFKSTWDAKTGRLINYNFDEADTWLLPDGRMLNYYFNAADFTNAGNPPHVCSPFDNSTCMVVEEETIKVYDKNSNAIKFEIHPADAYPVMDFSAKAAEIKDYAARLVQEQKAVGFSLVMQKDTLMKPGSTELLIGAQKNKQVLTDEGDYAIFIISPTDKSLNFSCRVTGNENRFYQYINYKDQTDELITSHVESWAGSAVKVGISLQYYYQKAHTPVTVLLFKNPDGPVTSAWKKQYADSVAAVIAEKNRVANEKKAFAPVIALAKSKMQPGEKIVLDTLILLDRDIYDKSFFQVPTEYDDQNNRTIYAAIRGGNDFLEVSPAIVHAQRELPPSFIRQTKIKDISITNISFTGPVQYFEVHNKMEHESYAYIIVTTRKDAKGYAINKPLLQKWEDDVAQENKAWDDAMKRNASAYTSFSSMADEMKKMLKDIYETAKVNTTKLFSDPRPSNDEMGGMIKNITGKCDAFRDYALTNEDKLKSLASANGSYKKYITAILKASIDIQREVKYLDETIKTANDYKTTLNTGNVQSGMSGIRTIADDALRLEY